MTMTGFIADFLGGACLYGALLIVMHKRPYWQRAAVFLLLLLAITLMIAGALAVKGAA